ncbi:MAG TPA: exodeoxyribonuclease V subunit alpha [Solirubrobacteraceae bacterium]|nr:exodeoxyribonuclease V subunit alpha [Solirubrobacteraceae bacterium]
MTGVAERHDPYEARIAAAASGPLREFNRAGVLSAADVHVARRLGRLGPDDDDAVLLAAALAVRAPRLGHVHVDLETIRDTAAVESDEETVDLAALPWPDVGPWIEAVAASPLVVGEQSEDRCRPLRLEGSWLYLDRYWAEEVAIAARLRTMRSAPPVVDEARLRDGIARLFGSEADGDQANAAAQAVRHRFAVVAGGPGTGKTTTVARIVALLCEQADDRPPLTALAAPTGKASARLQEAVHEEAGRLDVADAVRDQLRALQATTIHRLLGYRPGSRSRFRHDAEQRLAHDVVIVDETSMVSLSLMARLIEALRPDARLVLVGDAGQLASIEAGAVLGDIVGAGGGVAGRDGDGSDRAPRGGARPGISVLVRGHRYGDEIARVAAAIRAGDADEVIALLRASSGAVQWIEEDPGAPRSVQAVRAGVVGPGRAAIEAARDNRPAEALAALGRFRVLCAHRRGPMGVSNWTARIEAWLENEIERFQARERWYVGRPLLVTENDRELRLHNGDTGVVIRTDDDRVLAAFARGGEPVLYSPARLGAVDTVYAMTIHKSQGSQFQTAAVLLPEPGSRILTRELLYTAATRAQERLILVGAERTVRAAVERPIARASGLGRRLWGE